MPQTAPGLPKPPTATPATSQSPLTHLDAHTAVPTLPQPSTPHTNPVVATTMSPSPVTKPNPSMEHTVPNPSTSNASPGISSSTMPQPLTYPDPRIIPTQQPPHPNPRVAALQEEIARLEAELGGRDADAIVQEHIRLLHTYNEIKDGAQALIGKYALLTHTTVTAVHRELGLSLVE